MEKDKEQLLEATLPEKHYAVLHWATWEEMGKTFLCQRNIHNNLL
jgi:hypothetical protein